MKNSSGYIKFQGGNSYSTDAIRNISLINWLTVINKIKLEKAIQEVKEKQSGNKQHI